MIRIPSYMWFLGCKISDSADRAPAGWIQIRFDCCTYIVKECSLTFTVDLIQSNPS